MSVRTPKIALGPLEIQILEYLWRYGAAEVKAVSRVLDAGRPNSLNTIQSGMERLYRKGFLSREKVSHAYVYDVALSRAQMFSRVIGEVLESFSPTNTDNYLLAFVDFAAECDADGLDALEVLIQRKRSEQKGGGT